MPTATDHLMRNQDLSYEQETNRRKALQRLQKKMQSLWDWIAILKVDLRLKSQRGLSTDTLETQIDVEEARFEEFETQEAMLLCPGRPLTEREKMERQTWWAL